LRERFPRAARLTARDAGLNVYVLKMGKKWGHSGDSPASPHFSTAWLSEADCRANLREAEQN
jgi:hypothetical protein